MQKWQGSRDVFDKQLSTVDGQGEITSGVKVTLADRLAVYDEQARQRNATHVYRVLFTVNAMKNCNWEAELHEGEALVDWEHMCRIMPSLGLSAWTAHTLRAVFAPPID